MAIAKKPQSNTHASEGKNADQAAAAFITGAEIKGQPKRKDKKISVLIRFDPEVLEKIDATAKHRGINRTAWLHFIVTRALDAGDG